MPPVTEPAAPRLPGSLIPDLPVLADDATWEGHEVTGSFAGTVADHVDVAGCRLAGVTLTGAQIDRLRLVDTILEDCELSGAVLSRAALYRVEFRRCRLSGLIAAGAELADVRFVDCKLDTANFRMTGWQRSRLEGCLLTASDFREAKLATSRFDGCDLGEADFTKARLTGVALAGSRLDGLRGADALRGVVITSDQVVPLALAMFATMGIRIDDGEDGGSPSAA